MTVPATTPATSPAAMASLCPVARRVVPDGIPGTMCIIPPRYYHPGLKYILNRKPATRLITQGRSSTTHPEVGGAVWRCRGQMLFWNDVAADIFFARVCLAVRYGMYSPGTQCVLRQRLRLEVAWCHGSYFSFFWSFRDVFSSPDCVRYHSIYLCLAFCYLRYFYSWTTLYIW